MTASRGLVTPSLQQALLKLISMPVSLARIEQEYAVGDQTPVRAALFGLLQQGTLQAPQLKTETLSYSTCFEPPVHIDRAFGTAFELSCYCPILGCRFSFASLI